MMKKYLFLLFLLTIFSASVLPCIGQIDPILINAPNPNVFDCRNDVFIELMERPSFVRSTGGRTAAGDFMMFKAEVLSLVEDTWDGLDKSSFSVKYTGEDGTESIYPLDFAMSMMMNLRNEWKTFSDPVYFTSLTTYYLIFDVDTTAKEGWTLLFRPAERGSTTPYCETEIPLTIR